MQGLPSCNGWDFWHVKNKLKTTLLDEVRTEYREKKSIDNCINIMSFTDS